MAPTVPTGIPWDDAFDWNVRQLRTADGRRRVRPLRRLVRAVGEELVQVGPVRMGTEEELEQLEAKQEAEFALPADTQYKS